MSNAKGSKRHHKTIQGWSVTKALSAVPYITSVLQDVRQAFLDARRNERTLKLLDEKPGRLNRRELMQQQDAILEGQRAEDRYSKALRELATLDVVCQDPVRGLALIPFVHDRQPAWYLFDLFEEEHIRYWRFEDDPAGMKRPIAEVESAKGQAVS
jgi:hypothetical protein